MVVQECGGSTQLASGFFATDHFVFSAAHPLANAKSVEIEHPTVGRIAAEVVVLDQAKDIAVLSIEDPVDTWLDLAEPGRSGQRFEGQAATIVAGSENGPVAKRAEIVRQVSLTLDGEGRRDGFELAAAIERGDSGAPVVADDGRVIAMVFATSRSAERGWAIAANELARKLESIDQTLPSSGQGVLMAC